MTERREKARLVEEVNCDEERQQKKEESGTIPYTTDTELCNFHMIISVLFERTLSPTKWEYTLGLDHMRIFICLSSVILPFHFYPNIYPFNISKFIRLGKAILQISEQE